MIPGSKRTAVTSGSLADNQYEINMSRLDRNVAGQSRKAMEVVALMAKWKTKSMFSTLPLRLSQFPPASTAKCI